MVVFYILTILLLHSSRQAVAEDDVIQPPTGTVIFARSNATNVTTLQCRLFNPLNRNEQALVMWSLDNQNLHTQDDRFLFHGTPYTGSLPGITSYRDSLTILRFDPELDNQTLTCTGSFGGTPGAFLLRVFRPPGNITNITIEQGDTWIRLAWQPPSNQGEPPISAYKVSIETANPSQDDGVTIFTVNATVTASTIMDLLPTTTYVVALTTLTQLTESVETGVPVSGLSVTTQPPQYSAEVFLEINISQPCQEILSNGSAGLLTNISNSLRSAIEASCVCSYRRDYMYNTSLHCPQQQNSEVVHFRTTLLATLQWTKDQVQKFVMDYQMDNSRGDDHVSTNSRDDHVSTNSKGDDHVSTNNRGDDRVSTWTKSRTTTNNVATSSSPELQPLQVIVLVIAAVLVKVVVGAAPPTIG